MAEEEFALLSEPFSMTCSANHPEQCYAKVVFLDIEETYSTDADVVCTYTMTQGEEPRAGDQVAIFRVGWQDLQDHVICVGVQTAHKDSQNEFQVLFSAKELPKDTEYYQICYLAKINSEYVVRGASVPFQFRPPGDSELLVVETDDMAVVRSHQGLANDLKRKIYQLKVEYGLAQKDLSETDRDLHAEREKTKILELKLVGLEERNEILEKKVQDFEKIIQLNAEKESDMKFLNLEIELKATKVALDKSNLTIKELEDAIADLELEKNELHERMTKQNKKKLEETTQRDQDMMEALKQGKDVAVREMMVACAERDHVKVKLNKKIKELEASEKLTTELKKRNTDLLQSINTLQDNHNAAQARLLQKLETLTEEIPKESIHIQELEKLLDTQLEKYTEVQAKLEKEQELRVTLEIMMKKLEKELQEIKSIPLPPKPTPSTIPLYSVQKCAAAASEACVLSGRLSDVTNRELQVQTLQEHCKISIDCIKGTISTHRKKIEDLQKRCQESLSRKRDAEDISDVIMRDFHAHEFSKTNMELEEANVYLESALSRETELKTRLEDLEQEKTVLVQQHSQITRNLQVLADVLGADTLLQVSELHSLEAGQNSIVSASEEEINLAEIDQVSDLKKRLRLAAEEYQALYFQKLRLEKQVSRLKMKTSSSRQGSASSVADGCKSQPSSLQNTQ